jgi:hypothetical protein
MARETQLLIHIPADINEKIGRYWIYLATLGVVKSKHEIIITLLRSALKVALAEAGLEEWKDDSEGK